MNESKDPTVINGKRYSLWPQFVAAKERYIGGTLQEDPDRDVLALVGEAPAGGRYETEITDIRFEPNGSDSAAFFVDGKDFTCGSDVEVLALGAIADGWICFHSYAGHTWRIKPKAP